jgi:hypothetical protein
LFGGLKKLPRESLALPVGLKKLPGRGQYGWWDKKTAWGEVNFAGGTKKVPGKGHTCLGTSKIKGFRFYSLYLSLFSSSFQKT